MTPLNKNKETVSRTITKLLSGPDQPDHCFCEPDCDYDTLYCMARRIKAFFDRHPEDPGPVCISCDDRSVMAATLLASLAGGPELLIPNALSSTALSDLHGLTGFTRAIGSSFSNAPDDIFVIDMNELHEEAESLIADRDPEPDRPWIHLFTGGSTGKPRLWSKSPANLLGETNYLVHRFHVKSEDRILATVPPLHIYGILYSLLAPLVANASVASGTPSFPEEIKGRMGETCPTIFVSVPVHYRILKENPPRDGALRLAFSSAGPLAEDDGRAFSRATGAKLMEIYGSTETGGIATRCREDGEENLTPYACIDWKVDGDRMDIRSPFLSRELPVKENGWFTIADRVKAFENETFVVTGRADHIVKVGGNRVDLEKVRQAILEIPGAGDAIVITKALNSGRGQQVVAIVTGKLTPEKIKAALRTKLEPYERPRHIHMTKSIPMSATGKIDRRAVTKLTSSGL